MSESDDRKLVRQCLKGDASAFGSLVTRYQKPLYNTALQITGDEEDAKDVTQAVFVRAFRKLANYDPKYKFFSWIYKMLVNEAINQRARARNHRPLDPNLVDTARNPEEAQLARDLGERVEKAVADLPLDYRLVIVLRYFNDLSYKEIAYVVGVPEKTVKSRLYTARRRLVELLHSRGVYAHDR